MHTNKIDFNALVSFLDKLCNPDLIPASGRYEKTTLARLKQIASNYTNDKFIYAVGKSNTSGMADIFIEYDCAECQETFDLHISKTVFVSFLLGREKIVGYCDSCQKIVKARKKVEDKELHESFEHDMKKKIENKYSVFINDYLNPSMSWSKGTKAWEKYRQLNSWFPDDKEPEVAAHIQTMDYNNFLSTPYWTGISHFAKHKAKYRCKTCSSNLDLVTHHPTYDIHGYELQKIDELTVLCRSCHEIFHKTSYAKGQKSY